MNFYKCIHPAATAVSAGVVFNLLSGWVTAETYEEIIVNAEFRDLGVLEISNSVSVLGAESIRARSAHHIERLLGMVPNMNFSSGASRGKFFQIRGIGERSQFVDPVNPSVGLLIDGIDFTGLGLAANTLDIAQVEVLRGPQGTLYGANGLAGMINLESAAPTEQMMLRVGGEIAEYDTQVVNLSASGPLGERMGFRLGVQSQQSDGYTRNSFLNRDDTQKIDEVNARGRLQAQLADDLQLGIVGVYIDVDNGYDAFSLNNTRVTGSDEPGWDRQETEALSLQTVWTGATAYQLQASVSLASSDTEYGYDEDWSFVGFHPFEYSSTDNYLRDRENLSADVRFVSNESAALFSGRSDWVFGVYARSEDEQLQRRQSFFSDFETNNLAVYGQVDTRLSDRLNLITGLRIEERDADYSDSTAVRSSNEETLWGGRVALEIDLDSNTLLYGLVSRGYKAGGINGQIISAAQTNPAITSDVFSFDTEFMWNYEIGVKGNWLDQKLQLQVSAFYQDRNDVQAKQSIFNPADFSFDDFLTNAAAGESLGLEAEFTYAINSGAEVFGSLGLLDAEFKDFVSSSHVDARDDATGATLTPVDLDGRDLAHAPNYQYLLGTQFTIAKGLYLRLELEGKDAFYFSNSHSERSNAYDLFNARLGYRGDKWELALWGRNLGDEDYFVRGFYFSNQFGNNPANDYAPESYYQFGEPRVVGVSGFIEF